MEYNKRLLRDQYSNENKYDDDVYYSGIYVIGTLYTKQYTEWLEDQILKLKEVNKSV